MKNSLFLLITLITLWQANAQFIKEKSIDASIGLGYSYPYDDVDITGSGFYLDGEFVMKITSWLDLRPYAAAIFTSAEDDPDNEFGYKSTANAFLLGGKARIRAPIPWVAPYIEFGIGASIGSFETVTPFRDVAESGILMHIPWSVGLELGRKHNFDLAFSYFEHPSANQFCGAFAIGYSFPLEKAQN